MRYFRKIYLFFVKFSSTTGTPLNCLTLNLISFSKTVRNLFMPLTPTHTFCIDYDSRSVEQPARELAKKMQSILPSFSINVAYRSKKLSHLLSGSLKESISPFEQSNVIYKWQCPCGESSYIGMTGRQVIDRLLDHQRASSKSPIHMHFSNCSEYKKAFENYREKTGQENAKTD